MSEQEKTAPTVSEFLTEEEAMASYNRPRIWFYRERKSGDLTFYRLSGRILYKKSDLDEFFERHCHRATNIANDLALAGVATADQIIDQLRRMGAIVTREDALESVDRVFGGRVL